MLEYDFRLIALIWLGIAALAPFVAGHFSRHAGFWFLATLISGPLGLVLLLLLGEDVKHFEGIAFNCSQCRSAVKKGALKCEACQTSFDQTKVELAGLRSDIRKAQGNIFASIVFGCIAVAFVGWSIF